VKPVPAKVPHLGKWASIQAKAKDVRVLTKAQTERKEQHRKRQMRHDALQSKKDRRQRRERNDKIKAILAKRAALVSGIRPKHKRVRTTTRFRRPKTLKIKSVPKYPRQSVPGKPELNQYSIIKHPHVTETAMKAIEDHHTLVFIVDVRANKNQIKTAVAKLYNIKPLRINTLIRPDGKKKAFVQLGKDVDTLDVANRIGIV